MEDTFLNEERLFAEAFGRYKEKNIVLYGIGRYTDTIVSSLAEYHFIGLMDRDPGNLGKVIYGLPVISAEEAEKIADLIIINTREVYWELIYKRIQHVTIPVFFKNGMRAAVKDEGDSLASLDYWNHGADELLEKVRSYDIISFDLFDTLIMRRTYLPEDMFRIIERQVKEELGLEVDFIQARKDAISSLKQRIYMLDDVYSKMETNNGWDSRTTERIKEIELRVEKRLIIRREDMARLYQSVRSMKKELYIISDMYLPAPYLRSLLYDLGIEIDSAHLWISGELGADKRQSGLWSRLRKAAGDKKILHIGDDQEADIENPRDHGIDSQRVMGSADMLKNSSIRGVPPRICNFYESMTAGLVLSKLFNSPFALNERKGKVYFDDLEALGYCVFGHVILTFLIWLLRQCRQDHVKKLFFMARDCYLLADDYQYLLSKLKGEGYPDGRYLAISRRMAAVASIRCADDFHEVMKLPYSGTFQEYMEDRFDIQVHEADKDPGVISASADAVLLMKRLRPYSEALSRNIGRERENYLRYLNHVGCTKENAGNFAVVDLWYYGHSQYFLSKLLEQGLRGYYFNINLLENNTCCSNNDMKACFQRDTDRKGEYYQLYKNAMIFEGVFCAPHGMVKKIADDGTIICDQKMGNQRHFNEKIEINKGIKRYIGDFLELTGITDPESLTMDPMFSDELFGTFFQDNIELSDRIKKGFYCDNGLFHRREFRTFE